jgi:hypothetical protein
LASGVEAARYLGSVATRSLDRARDADWSACATVAGGLVALVNRHADTRLPAGTDAPAPLTASCGLLLPGRFAAAGEVIYFFPHFHMGTTEKARPAEQGTTSSASPVARFGNDTISAAVFREQRTTKKGKPFQVFNVSLRRSYRKTDGSFGTTHTLRERDLKPAIEALQDSVKYIADAANETES